MIGSSYSASLVINRFLIEADPGFSREGGGGFSKENGRKKWTKLIFRAPRTP